MAESVFALAPSDQLEIGKLIRRLSRPERVAWLIWCCQAVGSGERQCVLQDVIGTERETWEHWKALCMLWDLDMRASRAELELRVRGAGMPLLFRAMG